MVGMLMYIRMLRFGSKADTNLEARAIEKFHQVRFPSPTVNDRFSRLQLVKTKESKFDHEVVLTAHC